MTRRTRLVLAAAAALALLVLPASVGARTHDNPQLVASVGSAGAPDAYQISLRDTNGSAVTQLDPGTYEITVHDYSTIHDFHLFGANGVSESTDIEGTGDTVWTLTLGNGVYRFQCDAHSNVMHGTFRVGAAPPPPPKKPVALVAKVGPGKAISVRRTSGARVVTLKAGKAKVTVHDLSAKDNFHLIGPGASARTGVTFKGTRTWALTLRKGVYRFRSDAHPKLKGSFRVT